MTTSLWRSPLRGEQAVGSGLGDVHAHRVLAKIYRRQGLAKKTAAEDAEAERLAAALDPGPRVGDPCRIFDCRKLAATG